MSKINTKKGYVLIGVFTTISSLSLISLTLFTNNSHNKNLNKILTTSSIVNSVSVSSSSVIKKTSSNTSSSSVSLSSSSSSVPETAKIVIKIEETVTKPEPTPPPAPEPTKVIVQTEVESYTPPVQEYIAPKSQYVEPAPKPTPSPAPEPIIESVPEPTPPPVVATTNEHTTGGCNYDLAAQMLDLVNNHRAANGSGRLRLVGDLIGVACAHSGWMTNSGIFSHTGRDNTTPFERCRKAGTYCYAENVAYNTQPIVLDLFTQFKNSPGHNINMLDPDFFEMGIAFDGIYVTQLFR